MLVLHPPKLALTQRRVGLMPGGADTPLRPGERGRERECMGSTRGRKQVERLFWERHSRTIPYVRALRETLRRFANPEVSVEAPKLARFGV